MSKPLIPCLAIFLATAAFTTAQAQYGGGGMGGGGMGGGGMGGGGMGGGHRGANRPAPSTDSGPDPAPAPEPVHPLTPLNKIQIVGVIKAIDPVSDRITIAYEPVDALNWPAGTMPFGVANTALLKNATVGEKVRFKLESQQISDLAPYSPRQGD